MPKTLKIYNSGLVAASAVALIATSFAFPPSGAIALPWTRDGQLDIALGIAFWTILVLLASALPIRMPSGLLLTVSTAPIVAATILGGPAAGGWVALVGSTELREVRGEVRWYGTLVNHAGIVLPAIACGLIVQQLAAPGASATTGLVAAMSGAAVYFALNLLLVSVVVSLRTGSSIAQTATQDPGGLGVSLMALGPLGWLMSQIYQTDGGWWATLLFGLPLYTTRFSYDQFVRIREMFTQTIGALAEAVDKRDPFTADHSRRVKDIAVDIGREMRCSAKEMEALEWGGLLHDVGKIGVPDDILLKPGKLSREERQRMNAHPVLGAEIIGKVERLAPELPVIRHHHEWFNGSGYPDRLIGDEIPKLARILHVADAYEAMTADRPYRKGLSPEIAVAELRKFAGIQFDPVVVDAFMRTSWAADVPDPGRDTHGSPTKLRPGETPREHNAPIPGSPTADLV